jgi:outer membrane receptor protein involved in Fe transport
MRIGLVIPVASLAFLLFARLSPARCAETGAAVPQSVTGTVKDALGHPILGATVGLQNARGRIIGRTKTDSEGHFTFKAVRRGAYAIVAHKSGFKPGTAVLTVSGARPAAIEVALEAEAAVTVPVIAKRLNEARNALSPKTGGSVYRFTQQAIQELPQGNNTQLNQVLLQAPSVAQDSFGQVHVRGDHGNLQYRINGVQLPEGITGFGQVLSPRFANDISLLTGALPAEFGLHTAGVVDIKTRESLENTGSVEFYGGQRGTEQPSFEYGGSKGNLGYFLTGQYLHTDLGVEPPTPGPTPIHDTAHEGQGFGYFSYLLNSTTRLSLVTGASVNHFEIPNNPGQPQVFKLQGVPVFPSADLDERQFEQNYFGVLALQGAVGSAIDYQIAPFSRYSTVTFNPDHAGDLIFNGAASKVLRSDFSNGLQVDTAYHGLASHTLRIGGYFDAERAEVDNHESTFPASSGVQTKRTPISIVDDIGLQTWIYSAYVQDEWKALKSLTFNYGVRFDLYDGLVRADQASPRVGFEYTPIKGTTLHAGYARYFTPPETELVTASSVTKFLKTTGAPASIGNSAPTVERDHYFDAGIIQQVIPGLTLGVDSYYKKAVDLIDEGQFGPALIFENFNYAKGRVYGVEATSSYTSQNLYTYTNFAFSVAQGTQVESGQFNFAPDELRYINSHYIFLDHDQTFTSSVGGAYRWQGFTFSVDGLYGSGLRSGFANTGNLPYYIQVNAGITKPFEIPRVGHVEARVALVNLFDHIYEIRSGTGIGVFAPQFGPRRAFYGGLRWDLPISKP